MRVTFARHQLGRILIWAFEGFEDRPDDELTLAERGRLLDALRQARRRIAEAVRAIDPTWAPVADSLDTLPLATFRAELREAFETIRRIAHAVAEGRGYVVTPMSVQPSVLGPALDREDRPRWHLHGRPADAVTWSVLKLFAEVPRSLIRACNIPGCPRVFVATKAQRYCEPHQREARRQAQRRAEHAFRARQRATPKPKPRRKPR